MSLISFTLPHPPEKKKWKIKNTEETAHYDFFFSPHRPYIDSLYPQQQLLLLFSSFFTLSSFFSSFSFDRSFLFFAHISLRIVGGACAPAWMFFFCARIFTHSLTVVEIPWPNYVVVVVLELELWTYISQSVSRVYHFLDWLSKNGKVPSSTADASYLL